MLPAPLLKRWALIGRLVGAGQGVIVPRLPLAVCPFLHAQQSVVERTRGVQALANHV